MRQFRSKRRTPSVNNTSGVVLSSTLGKLYAKYLRSDATVHVQSAVLPTQLGGFPSKTIEFGNHLVYQRAAFYKPKGITSAVIFLDRTAAFYRATPGLVLGPLLDESARAGLLGAPSSCMEAPDYASRIQAAILDWGLHSGSIGLLLTGTPTPLFESATRSRLTGWSPWCVWVIHWRTWSSTRAGLLVSMQDLDSNTLEPAHTFSIRDQRCLSAEHGSTSFKGY